ncbi:MAG: AAC(3) family N-acetyltransferase [Ruminococcaceae bacterium]|nr:AAC(3) family N-acetyltransferase [Oscillospiraceae bacterium]
MKPITKDQIVFSLKLGGIENGDVVLMHSALSSIGFVEGGADAVIDAVLEAVGEEGTFAVSTMAFNHPYDPENDKSTVGIISEVHRLRKNSIRSLRPVHCINAIGAKAEELTRDHDKCATNCGVGSPYLKLRDMNGKIILLGVDNNRNTTLHAIEDIMDSVYLESRVFPAPKYVEGYENKTIEINKFCPGHRDFLKFTVDLRREGALTEVVIGNATAKIIDVKKMFELGQKLLSKDPLYFMCDNENCAYCANAYKQQAEKDAKRA